MAPRISFELPGLAKPITTEVGKITAIWAVEAALISGILLVVLFGYRNIKGRPAEGSRTAVGGAILAAMNTASEYGFGAVIAALPGFPLCCQKRWRLFLTRCSMKLSASPRLPGSPVRRLAG